MAKSNRPQRFGYRTMGRQAFTAFNWSPQHLTSQLVHRRELIGLLG